jgi:hypothetical protein
LHGGFPRCPSELIEVETGRHLADQPGHIVVPRHGARVEGPTVKRSFWSAKLMKPRNLALTLRDV